jgi:putative PEP-CTERM system TPR-repeat lipoprotein
MTTRRLLLTVGLCAAILSSCAKGEEQKRAYFDRANRLAAEKKYAEAIVEYRNALEIDDKFGEGRAKLAEAYLANGLTESAYREYQRAADLLPNDDAVQKRAATLLFMAGQYQDVRTRVLAVLHKNPKDVEAQLLYANALVGLNDLESGVHELEQAIEIDPQHPQTYTNLALFKMAQGQATEAKEAFEKAIDLDPKAIKPRLALASFYLASGDVAHAESAFKDALVVDPRDPLTNRTLAALFLATGRAPLAEQPLKLVMDVTGTARSRFALIDYYMRMKRAGDAKALLAPMVGDPKTFADAQMRTAQLAYEAGDIPGAKKQLAEVLTRYPGHSRALQLRARWLLRDGYLSQALERATLAVTSAPRDVSAIYLRGTLQVLNGQLDAAAKSFNDVLRLNPRAAAAQAQLSQLSLREGDAEQAVSLARESVANSPHSPEARVVLARALVAQRDLPAADAEVGRVLARYPKSSSANALRGTIAMLRGNDAVARGAFQLAFAADPGSIAALSGLTILDVRNKRLDEARARVDARLAVEPKRPELLVVAAKVYIAAGNLSKSETLLRQALDVAPAMPDPYLMLTEIYRTQNRVDAARNEFDALVQRDAANVGARAMGAILTHVQGHIDDATRRYQQTLEVAPRVAVVANNLAWIYAEQKQNLDVALDLAKAVTEQIPDYAEGWDTLGWVYQQKQLPHLAVAPFEKAVTRDGSNATFRYHLGIALAGAGDVEKARESLQMALKIQPGFPDAQREMKALQQ